VEEIVPDVALPPRTPFTSQVTLELDVPATLAWNCCVAPRKTFAVAGSTDKVTVEGGVVGGGDVCVDGLPAYPQPIVATAMNAAAARSEYFLHAARLLGDGVARRGSSTQR
jgi:hypothetical protein